MAEPEALRMLVEPLDRSVLDGVREFEGEPDRVRVDLGLLPIFADERPLLGLAGLVDWRSSGRLSALLRSGLCTASFGEQLLAPGDPRLPFARQVLVGLGPRASFDGERAEATAARLVDIAVGLRADGVVVALPSRQIERSVTEALLGALIDRLDAVASSAPPGPRSLGAAEIDEAGSLPASSGEPSQTLRARPPARWWVVADDRVVARLRRVLSGPPRAARDGSGLHT